MPVRLTQNSVRMGLTSGRQYMWNSSTIAWLWVSTNTAGNSMISWLKIKQKTFTFAVILVIWKLRIIIVPFVLARGLEVHHDVVGAQVVGQLAQHVGGDDFVAVDVLETSAQHLDGALVVESVLPQSVRRLVQTQVVDLVVQSGQLPVHVVAERPVRVLHSTLEKSTVGQSVVTRERESETEKGAFRRPRTHRVAAAGRPTSPAVRVLTSFGHFCGIQRKIGPVVVLQGMLIEDRGKGCL